jgi:membrane protein implicated in regulation of membrane protease activity
MNVIQEKMLEYNHGYFMAIGLAVFLTGFILQVVYVPQVLQLSYFQLLTVLGALLLGYGTGRCDQCTVQEN